jgi:hypothetical protein
MIARIDQAQQFPGEVVIAEFNESHDRPVDTCVYCPLFSRQAGMQHHARAHVAL